MHGDIVAVGPAGLCRFGGGCGGGGGFGFGSGFGFGWGVGGEETDGGGLAEEIAGAGGDDEGGDDVGSCGWKGTVVGEGGHWAGWWLCGFELLVVHW